MAVANGYGKTVTSGTVFMYDVGDTINSYKGEPTTNWLWHQNPRIDSSYESYMPGSGEGQMATLHPGAIRVYNTDGTDISDYRNTGINISNSGVEWYNTRHAYWILDPVLNRPVVRMFNQTGVWQAKHFNPAIGSLSNIGVTAGTKYVLSWLQYVDNLDRSAYVGLYSYSNTSGYWDFWDGLQAAYNTKTHTWQRVYAIFTATNNGQLGNYHNGYMYGQAVGSGDLRIADVQLEVKTHATQYSNSATRSVSGSLLPLVGNSTINVSNVSFDSNAQIFFDGTDDKIDVSYYSTVNNSLSRSWEVIVRPTTNLSYAGIFGNKLGYGCSYYCNGGIYLWDGNWVFNWYDNSAYRFLYSYITPAVNSYTHIVGTYDATDQKPRLYINGELKAIYDSSTNMNYGGETYVIDIGWNSKDGGLHYFQGQIPITKYYQNKALSAAEVRQNYNKYKTRFNLP